MIIFASLFLETGCSLRAFQPCVKTPLSEGKKDRVKIGVGSGTYFARIIHGMLSSPKNFFTAGSVRVFWHIVFFLVKMLKLQFVLIRE